LIACTVKILFPWLCSAPLFVVEVSVPVTLVDCGVKVGVGLVNLTHSTQLGPRRYGNIRAGVVGGCKKEVGSAKLTSNKNNERMREISSFIGCC
jgi:hypothetical protein